MLPETAILSAWRYRDDALKTDDLVVVHRVFDTMTGVVA